MSEVATPPGLLVVRHCMPHAGNDNKLGKVGNWEAGRAAALIDGMLDESGLSHSIFITPEIPLYVATAEKIAEGLPERFGVKIVKSCELTAMHEEDTPISEVRNPQIALRKLAMPEAKENDSVFNGLSVVAIMNRRQIAGLAEAGLAEFVANPSDKKPDDDQFGYGRVFVVKPGSFPMPRWKRILDNFHWARSAAT